MCCGLTGPLKPLATQWNFLIKDTLHLCYRPASLQLKDIRTMAFLSIQYECVGRLQEEMQLFGHHLPNPAQTHEDGSPWKSYALTCKKKQHHRVWCSILFFGGRSLRVLEFSRLQFGGPEKMKDYIIISVMCSTCAIFSEQDLVDEVYRFWLTSRPLKTSSSGCTYSVVPSWTLALCKAPPHLRPHQPWGAWTGSSGSPLGNGPLFEGGIGLGT